MHRIAVKPYMLLDQATDAFGVGMMAYLQLSISLPAMHTSDLMLRYR